MKFFGAILLRSDVLFSLDIDEGSETTQTIQHILEKVFNDINSEGRAVVVHEKNSLHLSVISLAAEPPQVSVSYQVIRSYWLFGWLIDFSIN